MPKGDYCKIDKQLLIDDFLLVKDILNKIPTREEYLFHGRYSRAPINRIFGGFNNMLRYLNLEVNCSRMDATREEVLNDAIELLEKYGTLNSKIHRKYAKYSQLITDRLFGSFAGLMRELGLRSEKDTRIISNDILLDILLSVKEMYGKVTVKLLTKHTNVPYQTFRNRFGDFEKLLNLKKNKHILRGSRSSSLLMDSISLYLNVNIDKEKTFNFLVNNDTGSKLFVDGYIEKYNLAIEYDGIQHFQFTEFFHKTYDDFLYRQKLDKLKDELLESNGIKLIRFSYNEPLTIEHIKEKLDNLI